MRKLDRGEYYTGLDAYYVRLVSSGKVWKNWGSDEERRYVRVLVHVDVYECDDGMFCAKLGDDKAYALDPHDALNLWSELYPEKLVEDDE